MSDTRIALANLLDSVWAKNEAESVEYGIERNNFEYSCEEIGISKDEANKLIDLLDWSPNE